ncbi:hypothetical protein B0H11DRAFT_2246300 [Mycena galericulata]|nr:hypothetical protein B0H11DRAFT_2246300 [Mycena galericulata]
MIAPIHLVAHILFVLALVASAAALIHANDTSYFCGSHRSSHEHGETPSHTRLQAVEVLSLIVVLRISYGRSGTRCASVVVADAALLAASWLNCMLFSLEVVLVVRYFQKPRPRIHQLGVGAIFAFDTVCTVAVCAQAYLVVLVFACTPDHFFPMATLRTLSVILFMTYATASVEQMYLCYLFFALTKQRFISVFLLALTNTPVTPALRIQNPGGPAFTTTKIGAISCAATDILIAAALLHTFTRMQSTSAVRVSTRTLLRRLMVMSFTSGVAVASTTSLTMILLIGGNPAYALFLFCQGRVYAVTILANFLVGIPTPPPTQSISSNPRGSAVTNVVFRVDYHSSGDGPGGAITHDYDRRNGDMDMDTLASPHPRGKILPDAD